MDHEDIIDILTDTLHYPELAQAIENLSVFDRKTLDGDLYKLVQKYMNYGFEISEQENESSYKDGYCNGYDQGYNDCEGKHKDNKNKK